jgi:hypothetical protein
MRADTMSLAEFADGAPVLSDDPVPVGQLRSRR